MSYAGIATATGTRLDSAAKHTMACKLDDQLHVNWHDKPESARLNLQNHKYQFAMQKDELVLNVTQKLNASRGHRAGAKAYPAVVTSTGKMPWYVKMAVRDLYASPSGSQFQRARKVTTVSSSPLGNALCPEDLLNLRRMWEYMPFFTVQGYALGTAWATPHSGDTVGTVLVGGMVTVRNGAFACRSGQPVMFYFDFEELDFSKKKSNVPGSDIVYEGERIAGRAQAMATEESFNTVLVGEDQRDPNEVGRKRSRELEYGQFSADAADKRGIALPKPYVLMNGHDHYGDKIRVFAKCVNGGRPHDMVDLMLMTQSL